PRRKAVPRRWTDPDRRGPPERAPTPRRWSDAGNRGRAPSSCRDRSGWWGWLPDCRSDELDHAAGDPVVAVGDDQCGALAFGELAAGDDGGGVGGQRALTGLVDGQRGQLAHGGA